MKTYGRRSLDVFTIISLVLMAIGWFLLAPVQMGGQATYVIISGNSMEPGFHLGDLVIVQQAPVYQVGDIVTYWNAELAHNVIHRIIGFETGHFILQGDNNSWIDSYRPTQDEIVGKLLIHIPTLGKAIEWARIPINMAVITAAMGGILMASTFTGPPQRGKNVKNKSGNFGFLEISISVLGLLALLFLGLGIFAFTRPTSRTRENLQYQQVGIFFYSAAGTPGIYDSDTVHSGEPIFPKLTCALNLGFAYDLAGNQLQEVSGVQQLFAKVTDDQSGWQRTIQLKPQEPFNNTSFSTSATLDLCQIETLVAAVEEDTGFHPSTYTLVVYPAVSVTGKIAGQEFHDTFEPRLIFKFDKVHFYLDIDNSQIDPLHFSKPGSVNASGTEDNTMSILGLEPRVIDIRVISALGLSLSFAGALLLAMVMHGTAQRSQEAFIRMKYGSLLVDVYDRGLETLVPMIDVANIDDLAKIAERQNTMILHMARDFLHFYFVQNNGTTYRYVASDGKNGPLKTEASGNKNFN
jgi:signal peptidase I